MRSRYSAYVEKNLDYILSTWHDSTRPSSLKLDTLPTIKWFRLTINEASEDQVTFTAWYKENGKACQLQERSQFLFEQDRWYYLSGNNPSSQNTGGD